MNELFRYSVNKEIDRGTTRFGPFNSLHEGYAILLEEIHELEQQVFKRFCDRSDENIYEECVQIAAIAYRITQDCIHQSKGN